MFARISVFLDQCSCWCWKSDHSNKISGIGRRLGIGCPILLLEGHLSKEFVLVLIKPHLNVLIEVFRKFRAGVLELNSAGK